MRAIRKIVSVLLLASLMLLIGPLSPFHTALAAKKMSLTVTKKILCAGDTVTITVKNIGKKKVTWSSSNKKVAAVTNRGVVKAVAPGKATIVAKIGKTKLKASVTVLKKDPSLLNDTLIQDLIYYCPSISESTQSTMDFYYSETDYKEDFPDGNNSHAWRILLLPDGIIEFFDENNGTEITVQDTGTAAEMLEILDWEIELLESLPSIQAHARAQGVNLLATMYVDDSSDCSDIADANGKINLLNRSKREEVLDVKKDAKGTLEFVNAFRALEELDTNGNGHIDFEELFQ